MASNVSQNIVPSLWSSANDDVLFEFSFNPYLMTDTVNSSGKVRVTLFGNFDVTPVVGEYIYINSNVYTGTYKILTVVSSAILILDLDYTSAITVDTYYCYHLRVPVFSFYKGLNPGEGGANFSNELPYTKVIDIKPSVKYSTITGLPYLPINLKGAVNYIFDINPNTVANSIDFSMFNAIRLTWDGLQTVQNDKPSYERDYFLVLNSSITNDELNYKYVSATTTTLLVNNGYTYLIPTDKPSIPSQGTAFFSAFNFYIEILVFAECLPIVHKFVNGIKQ